MQDLPPIPIPATEHWQSFKRSWLPPLIFGFTLMGIAGLWRQSVNPATFPGQVVEIKSTVMSPLAGTLTELGVSRFQMVTKGTPIATIQPVDNRVALDLMRSQLENLRARLDPEMAERGTELSLQKLLLPLLEQKISLATAQSNLGFAQGELLRAETLFKQNAVTAQAYDVALKKKQALEIAVKEKANLISNLSSQLEKLQPPAGNGAGAISALLSEQEAKLKEFAATSGPLILRAPIDGMVTVLERHAGEGVTAGQTIMVISACHCDRVVGYLREPFPMEPQVGMQVLVRSRSLSRLASTGRITHVGTQFEPIANPLLHPGTAYEVGLPVEVSLPDSLKVRPGALVDLTLTGNY